MRYKKKAKKIKLKYIGFFFSRLKNISGHAKISQNVYMVYIILYIPSRNVTFQHAGQYLYVIILCRTSEREPIFRIN